MRYSEILENNAAIKKDSKKKSSKIPYKEKKVNQDIFDPIKNPSEGIYSVSEYKEIMRKEREHEKNN